jgi:DNA-3-methyladenine glycosylase II
MTGTEANGFAEAARVLAAGDPVIAELVDRFGVPDQSRPRASGFETLTRAIVFQQLAGAAAATIYNRFRALVAGPLTPESVLELNPDDMRGAGLSRNKVAAITDLATHAEDGRVVFRGLARRSDDDVVERLVQVRGIGEWTAQMFLMSQLRRPDVWPTGDLGVRRGYGVAWGIDPMPNPAQLAELGDAHRPHRSLVARYCWLVADTPAPT